MSGLDVRRSGDHRSMPWANGGGTTYEVASWPPGSDLAGFDWRVSIAEIARGGPFSTFEGVDRVLLPLEGSGLELVVDGRVVPLVPHHPVRFPGEADTSCSLSAGPTADLNVMTRRGRAAADLVVVRVAGPTAVPPVDDAVVVLVVLDGRVTAEDAELGARDAVLVDRTVELSGSGHVAVVTITTDDA